MRLIKESKSSKTHTSEQTWNGQTSLFLNQEVMMVYMVCETLVRLGTRRIHIGGHSRGGTITLECAKEFNAQRFRRILVDDKEGGVVSYTPISAMPVFIEAAITSCERVNIIHGIYDTICDYNLLRYYYEEVLHRQSNVSLNPYNFGHLPWDMQVSLLGSLGQLGIGLWQNKSSIRGLFRTAFNFVKSLGYLTFGIKSFITEYRPLADNFNNACVVIKERDFSPARSDVTYRFHALPNHFITRITKGIWVREILCSQKEEQGRIASIVDLIKRTS